MTAAQIQGNKDFPFPNPKDHPHEILFPGTHLYRLPESLPLESGLRLHQAVIAYETFGSLNTAKNNAILICHALSGSAHVFQGTTTPPVGGWWDPMGMPGACFDPAKYFIICANILGSCYGSSGPASINPDTGKPYGLSFPVVTVRDFVRAQRYLLDHLGIAKLLAVVGGSLGGMQTLTWAIDYPERIVSAIPIATACQSSTQNIAFNEVGRQSILSDPNWSGGQYYGKKFPDNGLAIARMIGHITYVSETSMRLKFGRRLQDSTALHFRFDTDFAVEGYLKHKGLTFTKRFDANAYLFISKAIDYFDMTNAGTRTLAEAFARAKAKFLVLSYSSDWLYPPHESKAMVQALEANKLDVSYCNMQSDYGHDAFLLEADAQNKIISNFLTNLEV